MSRTTDMKLSGWVTEINFEFDFKFMELLNNKGPYGYYIYVLLRNAVCGQFGYYAIYNDVLLITIYHKLSKWVKSMKFVKETITYLGEIGILDKSLLQDNIITSAEIQESWLNAKRAKRARISDNLKYWLLDDNLPSNKDNNCSNNNNNCYNYPDNCSKKEDNCTIDKTIHNKLVNQVSKEIIIDNTVFPRSNEDKRNKTIIDRINEEMSSEPLNTDKYTVANMTTRFTAIKKDSFEEELELSLFNSLLSEDIRNKYLQMLSNACYDTQKQKYNGLAVDYKSFRFFVNKSKLSKLKSLMWTMEHAENVENEDYYMRGVIVNWVLDIYKQKEEKK